MRLLIGDAVVVGERFGGVVVGVCGIKEAEELRAFVADMVRVMGPGILPPELVAGFAASSPASRSFYSNKDSHDGGGRGNNRNRYRNREDDSSPQQSRGQGSGGDKAVQSAEKSSKDGSKKSKSTPGKTSVRRGTAK